MLQFADASGDQELTPASYREAPVMAGPAIPQLSLAGAWGAVRERAILLPVCAVLLLVAAILASALLPATYTSTAQIVVDPVDLNLLQNELTTRSQPSDAGVAVTETQAKILSSDRVLRRVVDGLHLERDKEFYKHPFWRDGGLLERTLLFLGAGTTDGDSDPGLVALENLRRVTLVRRTERTFAIDVMVKSEDPAKAARLANAITEDYLLDKADARSEIARRVFTELEARLGELRESVRAAESKVARYRQEHGLVTTSGRLPADQQITELTAQASVAQARTVEARARVAQAASFVGGARSATDAALPEVLQSAEVRALRQQVADLARSEAELAAKLGPRHPALGQMRAQIAIANRSLDAAIGRVLAVNRDELDRALAAEAAVSRSLTRLRSTAAENEQSLVTINELVRDAESRRSVYEAFLRRARETSEQDRLDNTNARVISTAVPARKRSFPPSPFILLPGATVAGLLLGAALAVLFSLPGRHDLRPSPRLRDRGPGELRL